jgi:kinesin family protein 4/21/27
MGTTGVGGLSTEYLGLVPRVIYFIFDQLGTRTDVALKVSYLEIYNEQIIDLLDTNAMNLQIREEKDSSISIPGLTEESVVSPAQMLVCLDKGGLNRTTASTNMNERSSRSHAIFTIHFEIAHPDDGSFVTAKFHFVDLAGSERLKKTLAVGQ